MVAGIAMAFGGALGDFGATVAVPGAFPRRRRCRSASSTAPIDVHGHLARNLALAQTAVAVLILVASAVSVE